MNRRLESAMLPVYPAAPVTFVEGDGVCLTSATNVLRLAPPLVVESGCVDWALEILADVLS